MKYVYVLEPIEPIDKKAAYSDGADEIFKSRKAAREFRDNLCACEPRCYKIVQYKLIRQYGAR